MASIFTNTNIIIFTDFEAVDSVSEKPRVGKNWLMWHMSKHVLAQLYIISLS